MRHERANFVDYAEAELQNEEVVANAVRKERSFTPSRINRIWRLV